MAKAKAIAAKRGAIGRPLGAVNKTAPPANVADATTVSAPFQSSRCAGTDSAQHLFSAFAVDFVFWLGFACALVARAATTITKRTREMISCTKSTVITTIVSAADAAATAVLVPALMLSSLSSVATAIVLHALARPENGT